MFKPKLKDIIEKSTGQQVLSIWSIGKEFRVRHDDLEHINYGAMEVSDMISEYFEGDFDLMQSCEAEAFRILTTKEEWTK